MVPTALVLGTLVSNGVPPAAEPAPPGTAVVSSSPLPEPSISFADRFVGRGYRQSDVLRLDAPEFTGTAKPGLFTLLREVRTGRKPAIDNSDYFRDVNSYIRDLDRRNGISFRDPCYWP